jgi:HK97 family phage major capsid protein
MTHPNSRTSAQLLAAGEIFRQYDGERVALDVASQGGGLPEFYRRLAGKIGSETGARAWDRAAGVPLAERELQKFSITRLARHQMSVQAAYRTPEPDPFDKNASAIRDDILRGRGALCPEQEFIATVPDHARFGGGTPIPWSALTRDFNVGTASEAGNLVASGTKNLNLTPDPARNANVLQRMGALMPGGHRQSFSVPILTSDQSNVAFVGEVAAATEGQPATGMVTFAPKRVTTMVETSRQSLVQGGGELLDMVLTRALFGSAMAAVEAAVMNGDGAGDNLTGIRSTAGITNVVGGANGAQINWGHVLDLENGPGLANAPETERAGYVVNSKTRRWLKATARGTNLPFMWDGHERPLNSNRAMMTNALPGTLVKGSSGAVCSSLLYSSDWSMLLMPIFGVPDLTIDPYKKADTGQVRLILNVYVGCGLLMPAAFSKMDDGLTA